MVGSCCSNHIVFSHLWPWNKYISTVPTAPDTSTSQSHSLLSHYPHPLMAAGGELVRVASWCEWQSADFVCYKDVAFGRLRP